VDPDKVQWGTREWWQWWWWQGGRQCAFYDACLEEAQIPWDHGGWQDQLVRWTTRSTRYGWNVMGNH
jgi:hypothetical protein